MKLPFSKQKGKDERRKPEGIRKEEEDKQQYWPFHLFSFLNYVLMVDAKILTLSDVVLNVRKEK